MAVAGQHRQVKQGRQQSRAPQVRATACAYQQGPMHTVSLKKASLPASQVHTDAPAARAGIICDERHTASQMMDALGACWQQRIASKRRRVHVLLCTSSASKSNPAVGPTTPTSLHGRSAAHGRGAGPVLHLQAGQPGPPAARNQQDKPPGRTSEQGALHSWVARKEEPAPESHCTAPGLQHSSVVTCWPSTSTFHAQARHMPARVQSMCCFLAKGTATQHREHSGIHVHPDPLHVHPAIHPKHHVSSQHVSLTKYSSGGRSRSRRSCSTMPNRVPPLQYS